jgi:SAM-dependent methyltransferase
LHCGSGISVPTAEADGPTEAPYLIEVMDEAVRYNRFLIDSLALWFEGSRSLLDFGAGNGRFANALQERGHQLFGVEPDPHLRALTARPGIDVRETLDAFDSSQRFDGLYSINVIEHIEDHESLMRCFFERLVPGGRILIYVPAFEVLFSANDARVGHLRRYRLRALMELVRGAGFEIDGARYVDSLGFFAGLGYRFFGNRDGGLNVGAVRLYDGLVFPLSRVLDHACQYWFGKNLLLTAVRPRAANDPQR